MPSQVSSVNRSFTPCLGPHVQHFQKIDTLRRAWIGQIIEQPSTSLPLALQKRLRPIHSQRDSRPLYFQPELPAPFLQLTALFGAHSFSISTFSFALSNDGTSSADWVSTRLHSVPANFTSPHLQLKFKHDHLVLSYVTLRTLLPDFCRC